MVAVEDPPLDDVFRAVVDIIHNLPASGPVKVTNDEKLTYYGLYKQATEGPCTKPKPSFWNVIEGYKWDAWNKLGNKDSEESKREYIDLVREKIRRVSKEYKVSEWMCGNDWDRLEPVMLPKFKMLDLDLVKQWGFDEGGPGRSAHVDGEAAQENGAEENGGGSEVKVEEENNNNPPAVEIVEKPKLEVQSYMSDDDYCDALESVEHSAHHSKKVSVSFCEPAVEIENHHSKHVMHRHTLPPIPPSSPSAFTRYAVELQQTVSILSDQIHRLSNSMAQQNSVIKRLVENSTAVMFFGMSWKQFIFLILWPIVVHFFMRRYLR
ncbi:hypothetical protein QR680_015126 [Steinernema hermaphroditum]|uniref:ACB domain-containing protein n=1 Tax=Steinernema hermaphroditum TaxID=289476 RepID=A0AA39M519_9BILA|nr:hypothetical protein QR680_015126 [Steinernema hermaphroditum]